jgi:hypothetical protein
MSASVQRTEQMLGFKGSHGDLLKGGFVEAWSEKLTEKV